MFLAQWAKLKLVYTAKVKKAVLFKGLPQTLSKLMNKSLSADTGITKLLAEIDAAAALKHRSTVMAAAVKFHTAFEKYADEVFKVAVECNNLAPDADNRMQATLKNINDFTVEFVRGINKMEMAMGTKLEAIQEKKSGGQKIKVFALEGDMNMAIDKYKTATKPFAAHESKYHVLAMFAPGVRAMKLYSQAVAKTEVKKAKEALTNFGKEVGDVVRLNGIVAKANGVDEKYKSAVKTLADALQRIVTARGTDSMRNLDELLKAK